MKRWISDTFRLRGQQQSSLRVWGLAILFDYVSSTNPHLMIIVQQVFRYFSVIWTIKDHSRFLGTFRLYVNIYVAEILIWCWGCRRTIGYTREGYVKRNMRERRKVKGKWEKKENRNIWVAVHVTEKFSFLDFNENLLMNKFWMEIIFYATLFI